MNIKLNKNVYEIIRRLNPIMETDREQQNLLTLNIDNDLQHEDEMSPLTALQSDIEMRLTALIISSSSSFYIFFSQLLFVQQVKDFFMLLFFHSEKILFVFLLLHRYNHTFRMNKDFIINIFYSRHLNCV